jgi:hypothetical protein
MNILSKFQNTDLVRLTSTFTQLRDSISSAFEGYQGDIGRCGEYFDFKRNGLQSIYLCLQIDKGTIGIEVIGIKLKLPHGAIKKAQENDGLVELVDSKVKTKTKWKYRIDEYERIRFTQEISNLSDDFLSDLVMLLEKASFVPRVNSTKRYF